jgi:excisionase family DNA binding protein
VKAVRRVRLASEPAPVSPYLTADEAAAYLRFKNARVLYKAIAARVKNAADEAIPALRRGRSYLFDRNDLDRWLRADPREGHALRRVR